MQEDNHILTTKTKIIFALINLPILILNFIFLNVSTPNTSSTFLMTSPKDIVDQVTTKPVSLDFNEELTDIPFDKIEISPKVGVEVAVDKNKMVITPKKNFNEKTTYVINVYNIRSIENNHIPSESIKVNTAAHTKNSFERKLPIINDNYMIEQNKDRSITATIYKTPIAQYREEIETLCSKNGIPKEEVYIIVSPGADPQESRPYNSD